MKKLLVFMAAFFLLFAAGCTQVPTEGPPPEQLTVTLSQTEAQLYVGESFTLTAEVNVEGAEIAFSTSNRSVVSFAADGYTAVVTAEGLGEAEIRVRQGEELLAKCRVSVIEEPKDLEVFLPAGKLVLSQGQRATVRAIAAESVQGEPEWTVSDDKIASIEFQGLIAMVTAVSAGECTVTVTCGGESDSFTLIVNAGA